MEPPQAKPLFVGVDFEDPEAINNDYFDPHVFEDQKEENLLRKIEDFKRHFLEMKEKAEIAEKDLALSEIKVEEVIKRS